VPLVAGQSPDFVQKRRARAVCSASWAAAERQIVVELYERQRSEGNVRLIERGFVLAIVRGIDPGGDCLSVAQKVQVSLTMDTPRGWPEQVGGLSALKIDEPGPWEWV
jgi:hypothetical protein